MTAANVIGLHRMTESEFDRERERIGPSKIAAGIRWEQELALLFHRSGWTQEQLAKKEGKSQRHVGRWLQFGRFLGFSPMGLNPEKTTFTLTERRFRQFWEQTTGGNERIRFIEVGKLIEAAEVLLREKPRLRIGNAIIDQFADGKYHRPETIAKALDTDPDHVVDTITNLSSRRIAKVDRRRHGGDEATPKPGFQYRIFGNKRTISLDEAATKLTPIVKGLLEEGKKNMATMSPATVAYLAGLLRKLLDEWAE